MLSLVCCHHALQVLAFVQNASVSAVLATGMDRAQQTVVTIGYRGCVPHEQSPCAVAKLRSSVCRGGWGCIRDPLSCHVLMWEHPRVSCVISIHHNASTPRPLHFKWCSPLWRSPLV